ncbi:17673_t:CDS:2, partial [Racocetra persica]
KQGSGNYRPLETQAVTLSSTVMNSLFDATNIVVNLIIHFILLSSGRRKMNLKRDFSHFKINNLQVKQQMVATGSNAIQISDNRKHLRNSNGEPVKISSEKTIECEDKLPENIKEWTSDHVKKFLESRMKDLDFNETDVKKIRGQDLTGRAFLRLTEEKLTRKPGLYELKPSPAESIMELVEEPNEKLAKKEAPSKS